MSLNALDRADVWLNSEPLTAAALQGSVVAVDFWTFTCVNWLRTLPYVRAWHETYRDNGLVVIGAHAPEFSFEHDLDNVRRAVADLNVDYPVVIDNDFSLWRAFDNHYWPAIYLVDGKGKVKFTHFGESAYEETERAIQKLLGVDRDLVDVDAGGVTLAADWNSVGTPETYVGYAQGEGRSEDAGNLRLNRWALTGDWAVGAEDAALLKAPGSIRFHYAARDVNLVLTAEKPTPFTVTVDGREAQGIDTDEHGQGTVDEPRMYQLVRGAPAGHTVEITFHEPGVRAYVFTFG
jgi:thiol-disulfide isomerase/thioredoxin